MFLPLVRPIFALLSLALLAGGALALWQWYDGALVLGPDGIWRQTRGPLWQLLLGLVLLAFSLFGRPLVLMLLPAGPSRREPLRSDAQVVKAPDYAELHVESCGVANGPVVIMTHGWGLEASAWAELRSELGERFRVVSWDLPGLGRSEAPPDGKLNIERFAQALGSVVEHCGADKVVLVGHSIGGMISQTFWRACSDEAKQRVAGMVLIHATHTNPLRTMWLSGLWTALQKPLIEPMSALSVPLSPLVWLSNWQSYLSGSLHLATWLVSFGAATTREKVELAARLTAKGSPAVQAKGNLAMLYWSMTEDLGAIPVPVLVLAGSSDIITLPRASEEIAAAVPSGRLQTFERTGHLGYLERHEAYAEQIAAFAETSLSRAAAVEEGIVTPVSRPARRR